MQQLGFLLSAYRHVACLSRLP